MAATSCTRMMSAPPATPSVVSAAVPSSRSSTGAPSTCPIGGFAGWAKEQREPEAAKARAAVGPSPGSVPRPTEAECRDRARCGRGRSPARSASTRVAVKPSAMSSTTPWNSLPRWLCMAIRAQPVRATELRHRWVATQASDVVDGVGAVREGSLGHSRMIRIDRDGESRGRDERPRVPVEGGGVRRRETAREAPGRLDSAPMSRKSAPSASKRAARAAARRGIARDAVTAE